LRMKREDWDAVLRTNLDGAYPLHSGGVTGNGETALRPQLSTLARWWPRRANAGQANYIAAKAA